MTAFYVLATYALTILLCCVFAAVERVHNGRKERAERLRRRIRGER